MKLCILLLVALFLPGGCALSGQSNVHKRAAECAESVYSDDQEECVKDVARMLDPDGDLQNLEISGEGGMPTPPVTVYTFTDPQLGKCETITFSYIPSQDRPRQDPGFYRIEILPRIRCG